MEWNIGEAAGALAAFALGHDLKPRQVRGDPAQLRAFQASLVAEGVPLAWAIDVPANHPAFAAVQNLLVSGRLEGEASLAFRPAEPISPVDWRRLGGTGEPPASRAAAAEWLFGG